LVRPTEFVVLVRGGLFYAHYNLYLQLLSYNVNLSFLPKYYHDTPRRLSLSASRRSYSPPSERPSSPQCCPFLALPLQHSLFPADRTGHHDGVTVPQLSALIWERFGLLSLPNGYELPEVLKPQYDRLTRKTKLSSTLGHWNEDIPPENYKDLTTYVTYLSFDITQAPRPAIPPTLADTVPGNPRGFPYGEKSSAIVVAGLIDGKTWYMLTPSVQPPRDVAYDIVVDDPLTVNQLLRARIGQSKYHIASFMVARGITCKTLHPYSSPQALILPSPPVTMSTPLMRWGVGIRESSAGAFTADDYNRYLQLRDEIIYGESGRAAYLAGGILWRLAMDARRDVGFVLDGPGEDSVQKNYVLFDGKSYVDNTLTEHQEDIICGVYRVVPSKPRSVCAATSADILDCSWRSNRYKQNPNNILVAHSKRLEGLGYGRRMLDSGIRELVLHSARKDP
jgi:hypothetical protein